MRPSSVRVRAVSALSLMLMALLVAFSTARVVDAAGPGVRLGGTASAPVATGSMTTRERLALAAWWPTQGTSDGAGYVGTGACAGCHAGIVRSQAKSQMAHTLAMAGSNDLLKENISRQYRAGSYVYSLDRERDAVKMKVSDGVQSQSAELRWAFGSGEVGQSYLWQQTDGSFREARFNYFATLQGFAATPGRLHGPPVTIDMALGRRVEGFEAKTCFACHTTRFSSATPVDVKSFVAGVTCEACHGPGARHAAAMGQGEAASPERELHIVNAGHMTAEASVDFCGACHATPWDVRLMGATGLQTVRFPAYRLEKSRCWGTKGDRRVTCIACHDPHAPLERDPVAYDRACLGCHASDARAALDAQHNVRGCPVAKARCVTCHMQKEELPEMHAKFTDHMIRVVRRGDGVPD